MINVRRILEIIGGILIGFIASFFTGSFLPFQAMKFGMANQSNLIFMMAFVLVEAMSLSVGLIYVRDFFKKNSFSFQTKLKGQSGRMIIYILLLTGLLVFLNSVLADISKAGEVVQGIFFFFLHPLMVLVDPFLLINVFSFWLFYFILALIFVYIGVVRKTVVLVPLAGLIGFYLFHIVVAFSLWNIIQSEWEWNLVYLLFVVLLIGVMKKTLSHFDSN